MIDIAKLHRKSGNKKILGKFFATSGYKNSADYLRSTGLSDNEITVGSQAHRGAVGVSKVHPVIFIEYLRWADFDNYADWVDEQMKAQKDIV